MLQKTDIEALRNRMQDKGTLAKLNFLSEISYPQLWRIAKGKDTNPTVTTYDKIIDGLNELGL